ncbi:MAG: hypothetical protein ACLFN8_00790 [Candidatus Woesearchaeota archaeon]
MTLDIIGWTEAYLRYKDSIKRSISKIDVLKDKGEIVCVMKDGSTHKYLCVDNLIELDASNLDNVRVSCLNTKVNFDWLINNWSVLKNVNIIFLFANPQRAMHWTINPKIHDNITDKGSIKSGLLSLFESVPEV